MFGTLSGRAKQAQAVDRVAGLVRERFRLEPGVVVLVTELECALPGCPPLETVIAFWTATDRRHHLKVFKPLDQVVAEDLPPWWMRDALQVAPGFECECC